METPVLIPNTEVKHRSADGTRKGRVGSRQFRELNTKTPPRFQLGGVFGMMGVLLIQRKINTMNKKQGFINTTIIVVVVVVIVGIVGYIAIRAPQGSLTNIVGGCTKDAKVCPDGSSVGRVFPSCEFAHCPIGGVEITKTIDITITQNTTEDETAKWKIYRNEEYGFELKYPTDLIKQKIVSDDHLLSLKGSLEVVGSIYFNIYIRKNYNIISKTKLKEIKIGDRIGYKYFFQEGAGYSGVVLIQLGQDKLSLIYDLIGSSKKEISNKETFVKNNLEQILSTFNFID